jgi:hypothetical protein
VKVGEFTLSGTVDGGIVFSSAGGWERRFPIPIEVPPSTPVLLRGYLDVGEEGLKPVVETVFPLSKGAEVDVNEAWALFRPTEGLSVVVYSGEDPWGRRFLVETQLPLLSGVPYWVSGLLTVRNYPLLGARWVFKAGRVLALREFPKL